MTELKTGLDDGVPIPKSIRIQRDAPSMVNAWLAGNSTRAVAYAFDVSHETVAQLVRGRSR